MGKGQKTRVSGKEQYKGGNYSAGRRPDLTSGKSEGLADFRGKFVSHDPRHVRRNPSASLPHSHATHIHPNVPDP